MCVPQTESETPAAAAKPVTTQQKTNDALLEAARMGRVEDVRQTISGGAKIETSDGVCMSLFFLWSKYFMYICWYRMAVPR